MKRSLVDLMLRTKLLAVCTRHLFRKANLPYLINDAQFMLTEFLKIQSSECRDAAHDFLLPRHLPVKHRMFILQKYVNKHSVCANIGTESGDYPGAILQCVKPRKLFIIDPWIYQPDVKFEKALYGRQYGRSQGYMDNKHRYVESRFKREVDAGAIEIMREYDYAAHRYFVDNSLDFIYLDADHSHEGVKRALESFFPKLRKGGIFAGDDWHHFLGGAERPVTEFIGKGGREQVELLEVTNNQFVLRKTGL